MARSRSSQRWTVAFAASLMNMVQTGAFFMTPTTLMPEVVADFGLDLSLSTVPIAVGKIAYVMLLIPGGIMVDKYGPRRSVLFGLFGLAILLSIYAWLVHSFVQQLIIHILLATTASVSGVPVYSIFIAQWFDTHIGLAMGLVLAGYSAGGTLAPMFLGIISDGYGWRVAMGGMCAILWGVGLPVAYFLLHEPNSSSLLSHTDNIDDDTPSSILMSPSSQSLPTIEVQAAQEGMSQYVMNHPRWTFAGFASCYILLQYCVGCFFENIMFYLHKDCGIQLATASLYFSMLNFFSFSAKLSGGYLGDRYNRFNVALVMNALTAVSIMSLFCTEKGLDNDHLPHLTTNHSTIILFVVLFGFGYGGVFNCLYSLVPLVFGKNNLGATQSSLFGLGLVGNAVGSVLSGVLRSKFGSYQVPFLVAAVACLLNFLAFNLTRLSLDQPCRHAEEKEKDYHSVPHRRSEASPLVPAGPSEYFSFAKTLSFSSLYGEEDAPPLRPMSYGEDTRNTQSALRPMSYGDDTRHMNMNSNSNSNSLISHGIEIRRNASVNVLGGRFNTGRPLASHNMKRSSTVDNLIQSGVLSASLETPVIYAFGSTDRLNREGQADGNFILR